MRRDNNSQEWRIREGDAKIAARDNDPRVKAEYQGSRGKCAAMREVKRALQLVSQYVTGIAIKLIGQHGSQGCQHSFKGGGGRPSAAGGFQETARMRATSSWRDCARTTHA